MVAHQGAGIELVVAKSFQRIFQENMVYSGLPFTTDFSVLDRLIDGDEVDLAALAAELPPFFRAVAAEGGLLRYGTKLLAGELAPSYRTDAPARPMTCIEKIVAARTYRGAGQATGVGQRPSRRSGALRHRVPRDARVHRGHGDGALRGGVGEASGATSRSWSLRSRTTSC